MTGFPWPPASATGIGSLPGTDIAEAIQVVFGELPDFPHLPELPARGPGADMIGRTAGLLVDMPVELYVGQWRSASHSGRDARRTADLWERDMDALTDYASDFGGPLKVQVAGPWTLAASVDLPVGGRMLRDPGAVRDLTASLAEGVVAHIADLRARVPHAQLVLQLDEPSLPAILAGHVSTESGFSRLRAIDGEVARTVLTTVIAAAGVPTIVHCCAAQPPLRLIAEAGAVGIAVDLEFLDDIDALGEVLESGTALFAGAVEATGPESDSASGPDSAAAAARVTALWKTIGFSINSLPEQVVVTPACGLAGASGTAARRTMSVAREAGHRLAS